MPKKKKQPKPVFDWTDMAIIREAELEAERAPRILRYAKEVLKDKIKELADAKADLARKEAAVPKTKSELRRLKKRYKGHVFDLEDKPISRSLSIPAMVAARYRDAEEKKRKVMDQRLAEGRKEGE